VPEVGSIDVSIRVSSDISRMVMNLVDQTLAMFIEKWGASYFEVSASTNIHLLSRSRPRFVRKDFLIDIPRHDFMG